jgi:hypothetical protein
MDGEITDLKGARRKRNWILDDLGNRNMNWELKGKL